MPDTCGPVDYAVKQSGFCQNAGNSYSRTVATRSAPNRSNRLKTLADSKPCTKLASSIASKSLICHVNQLTKDSKRSGSLARQDSTGTVQSPPPAGLMRAYPPPVIETPKGRSLVRRFGFLASLPHASPRQTYRFPARDLLRGYRRYTRRQPGWLPLTASRKALALRPATLRAITTLARFPTRPGRLPANTARRSRSTGPTASSTFRTQPRFA